MSMHWMISSGRAGLEGRLVQDGGGLAGALFARADAG